MSTSTGVFMRRRTKKKPSADLSEWYKRMELVYQGGLEMIKRSKANEEATEKTSKSVNQTNKGANRTSKGASQSNQEISLNEIVEAGIK